MPTTTANLGLTLPTPNVDTGWGSTLNTDFTLLDNIFAANGTGTSIGLQVGSGRTLGIGGTLILGSGDGTGTVVAPTIRGAARTGTNVIGANLTIDAANGTGTGGSGSLIFRTAPALTSGTTANTMTERMRIDNSGNIGIGGTPGYKLDVVGPSGVASFTGVNRLGVMVRGSSSSTDYSGIDFSGAANATTFARIGVLSQTAGSSIVLGTSNNYASGITNTALTIDPSGNVLARSAGLGYGAGAGGTVTQLTSKATTITLNKPSGQITTSNSALAGGATAIFLFTNTFISPADTLILNLIVPSDARYNSNVYEVRADIAENGSNAYIRIKNISATSQSDALLLNFAVIKGATT